MEKHPEERVSTDEESLAGSEPRPLGDGLECALLSEEALSEWNSEEEDAAWAHLQREA